MIQPTNHVPVHYRQISLRFCHVLELFAAVPLELDVVMHLELGAVMQLELGAAVPLELDAAAVEYSHVAGVRCSWS